MTRTRGLVGLLTLVFAASTLAAGSCRCLRRSLRAYLDQAPSVFMGEVLPAGESGFQRVAKVSVRRVWKGDVPGEVAVETPADEALCGLDLTKSGRFLFFSARFLGDGRLHGRYPVSVCEGSRPWDEVLEAELGEGRKIEETPTRPTVPTSTLEGTGAAPIPIPGG